MAEQLEGVVGNPTFQAAGTRQALKFDEYGGLFSSQLNAPLFALTRLGKTFFATHTVATAVAPLQVVPTTTAAFVLNNVSATPKLLVILKAGLYFASGTAGAGTSLWGLSTSTPLATQLTANGTGVTVGNGLGTLAANSIAFGDTSKTVAGNWALLGGMDNAAAAVPGFGLVADLGGGFVVQPTYAFGLHAVAGTGTTSKFSFFAQWVEIDITVP